MVNCQGRAVKLPGSICQDKFCDFKETPFRHQGFSADRRQHPNQHNVFTSDIHQLTKSIHGLAKMSLDMDRQEPVDWQLTMSPSFGGRISRNYRNYTTLGCIKTLQSMVSQLPTNYCSLRIFHDAHHPAGLSRTITDLQLRNFEKSRPRPPVSPSREFPGALFWRMLLRKVVTISLMPPPGRDWTFGGKPKSHGDLNPWRDSAGNTEHVVMFFLLFVYPK